MKATTQHATQYQTYTQQNTPRELATFCEVFACSVERPIPATRDPYPSSIPLVHCFGITLPVLRCNAGA